MHMNRRWAVLLPVTFVTYSLAYLDRANFGFGAAARMALCGALGHLHRTRHRREGQGFTELPAVGRRVGRAAGETAACEEHGTRRGEAHALSIAGGVWACCIAAVVGSTGAAYRRTRARTADRAVVATRCEPWRSPSRRLANPFAIPGDPPYALWRFQQASVAMRVAGIGESSPWIWRSRSAPAAKDHERTIANDRHGNRQLPWAMAILYVIPVANPCDDDAHVGPHRRPPHRSTPHPRSQPGRPRRAARKLETQRPTLGDRPGRTVAPAAS